MLNRIGPNEVRITKVITTRAGEVSDEHNPTPNWAYGGPALQPFDLRIEAEAGATIGNSPTNYTMFIHCVCLAQPGFPALGLLPPPPPPTNFAAANWDYDPAGERYTKNWTFAGLVPVGFQMYHNWHYIVSIVDTATRHVACTYVSDPFIVV